MIQAGMMSGHPPSAQIHTHGLKTILFPVFLYRSIPFQRSEAHWANIGITWPVFLWFGIKGFMKESNHSMEMQVYFTMIDIQSP